MNFRTRNDKPTSVTPAGKKTQKTYSVKINERGAKEVYASGETDVYQRIQSHAEETKVSNIIASATRGDMSGFASVMPQYIDCTEMPTTYAEMLTMTMKAQEEFNKLPLEIRKEYNFSAEEYLADAGSDKMKALFERYKKANPVIKQIPEVETNAE